ncbi:Vexin, partial [Varanus komodoensis]
MHQIYSCSDENLEVFTVISSKFGGLRGVRCSKLRQKAYLRGIIHKPDFARDVLGPKFQYQHLFQYKESACKASPTPQHVVLSEEKLEAHNVSKQK